MSGLLESTGRETTSALAVPGDGYPLLTGVSGRNRSVPESLRQLAAVVGELLAAARRDYPAWMLRMYQRELQEAIRSLNYLDAEKRRIYRSLERLAGFRDAQQVLDREPAALAADPDGERAPRLAGSRSWRLRRKGRSVWRRRRP